MAWIMALVAPAPAGGGVWAVDAFSERQTYGAGGGEVVERRRSALLSASDWITGVTRLEAGLGIDGWSGESSGLVRGAVLRELADGLAQAWAESTLVVGDSRGAALDIGAQWRSTEERTGSVLHTRGGFSAAAASLPFAFWPGAGTGQGRAPLLRAHPLLRDGGIEWRRWRGPLARAIRIAPAVFVDAARAFKAPAFGDQRTHVDVGVGVRLAIPTAGVVRVDVARGLRDGEMALSIGLTR